MISVNNLGHCSGNQPATTPSKSGKLGHEDPLAPWQRELNDVARRLQHSGKRLVLLTEGRRHRRHPQYEEC